MKRIFLLLFSVLLFASCQKEDENGDLGGFWKLLKIEKLPAGHVEDTRGDDRFWAIQLKMITTNNGGKGRFQYTGDSLFVQMLQRPADPKAVGLYNHEDERFEVIILNRNSMVLRSKDAVLTLRKF